MRPFFFITRSVHPQQNTVYEEYELACPSLAPCYVLQLLLSLVWWKLLTPCCLAVYLLAEADRSFTNSPVKLEKSLRDLAALHGELACQNPAQGGQKSLPSQSIKQIFGYPLK